MSAGDGPQRVAPGPDDAGPPGPADLRVVWLEEALHAKTVRADCLQARLVRCQGVLTAIRAGLYAELAVLKEKVYQRTQLQTLLDQEISSLLHAVMLFLQQQAGDIFEDPLHVKQRAETGPSSVQAQEAEQAMALEISRIRQQLQLAAQDTERHLRRELAQRDRQLLAERARWDRLDVPGLQRRLMRLSGEVVQLRAGLGAMRDTLFETWRAESEAMTIDVVAAALRSDRERRAEGVLAVDGMRGAVGALLEEALALMHAVRASAGLPPLLPPQSTVVDGAPAIGAAVGPTAALEGRLLRRMVQHMKEGVPLVWARELTGLAAALAAAVCTCEGLWGEVQALRGARAALAEEGRATADQMLLLSSRMHHMESAEAAAQKHREGEAQRRMADLQAELQAALAAAEQSKEELRRVQENHTLEVQAMRDGWEKERRAAGEELEQQLRSLALTKEREMWGLVEAKDQQLRHLQASLDQSVARPRRGAACDTDGSLPRCPTVGMVSVGLQTGATLMADVDGLWVELEELQAAYAELQERHSLLLASRSAPCPGVPGPSDPPADPVAEDPPAASARITAPERPPSASSGRQPASAHLPITVPSPVFEGPTEAATPPTPGPPPTPVFSAPPSEAPAPPPLPQVAPPNMGPLDPTPALVPVGDRDSIAPLISPTAADHLSEAASDMGSPPLLSRFWSSAQLANWPVVTRERAVQARFTGVPVAVGPDRGSGAWTVDGAVQTDMSGSCVSGDFLCPVLPPTPTHWRGPADPEEEGSDSEPSTPPCAPEPVAPGTEGLWGDPLGAKQEIPEAHPMAPATPPNIEVVAPVEEPPLPAPSPPLPPPRPEDRPTPAEALGTPPASLRATHVSRQLVDAAVMTVWPELVDAAVLTDPLLPSNPTGVQPEATAGIKTAVAAAPQRLLHPAAAVGQRQRPRTSSSAGSAISGRVRDVWECANCHEVNAPMVGKCPKCGRARRSRPTRPAPRVGPAQLPASPAPAAPSNVTTPDGSPQSEPSMLELLLYDPASGAASSLLEQLLPRDPPAVTQRVTQDAALAKYRERLALGARRLRHPGPTRPPDLALAKFPPPITGAYLAQLPLPVNFPLPDYPDLQYLSRWRRKLKGAASDHVGNCDA